MTQIIITLYEDHRTAMTVIEELREAGFDTTQVEALEEHPRQPRYILRRPGNGPEEVTLSTGEASRALQEMELSPEYAEICINELQEGSHLVLVRSGDELAGRAKQILNKYSFEDQADKTSYDSGRPVP